MNNKKENDCFIWKKPSQFSRNYTQAKMSKDLVHLFEDIYNHIGIYLNKEKNLELIFSLEKELMEDTLFSLDIYKELRDIYANDLYLILVTK